MLNALSLDRVNVALGILQHYDDNAWTTKDIQRLVITPDEAYVISRIEDEEEYNVILWYRDEESPNLKPMLAAAKQLYGGDLHDVLRIEVFNGGYLVETRTDVLDYTNDTLVREVRVGHLIKPSQV